MEDRLARLRETLDSMKGIERVMMEDLIAEYDALASMTERLREKVNKDGVMIEKTVGTVNNRRVEEVENPAFTAYSKAIGRQSDLAKKISAFVRHDETPEASSIGAFVAQRPVPKRSR